MAVKYLGKVGSVMRMCLEAARPWCQAGAGRRDPVPVPIPIPAAEHAAFSTALFLSQVRLKMLCDTVIDSNLGINTSPQAPAQLIICIINTHIK